VGVSVGTDDGQAGHAGIADGKAAWQNTKASRKLHCTSLALLPEKPTAGLQQVSDPTISGCTWYQAPSAGGAKRAASDPLQRVRQGPQQVCAQRRRQG